jgi:hypothetical protein
MIGASTGPQGQAPLQASESSGVAFTFAGASFSFFVAQQFFVEATMRVAQHPVLPVAIAFFAQQQRPAARDSAEHRQESFAEPVFTCGPNPVGNPRFIATYITSIRARQRRRRVIQSDTSVNSPRTSSIWFRSVVIDCRAIMTG